MQFQRQRGQRGPAAPPALYRPEALYRLQDEASKRMKDRVVAGTEQGIQLHCESGEGSNGWYAFGVDANQELTNACRSFLDGGPKSIDVASAGRPYSVDFVGFVQKSTLSGTLRTMNVRCEVPEVWSTQE